MYICTYFSYVCMYVYMYICIYVCVCVCVCVCKERSVPRVSLSIVPYSIYCNMRHSRHMFSINIQRDRDRDLIKKSLHIDWPKKDLWQCG